VSSNAIPQAFPSAMSIDLKLRATAVTLIDADFPPAETLMVPVPGADALMWICLDPNPF